MHFTCSYCNHDTTIVSTNEDNQWHVVGIDQKYLKYDHKIGVGFSAIVCPNKDCKELTFVVRLSALSLYEIEQEDKERIHNMWELLPESSAKPQPSYIPKPIIQDYEEACRIKTLSPKASATLARRCLQGMIRDFHGITEQNLKKEIDALKDKILEDEWEAIDALRSIGNIGAHMEKDVNLIVDMTADEAHTLIKLIEYLFKNWYVKRHDNQKDLEAIRKLADSKKAQKKPSDETVSSLSTKATDVKTTTNPELS